jgi:L-rhamnono-1,4-lactonase
MPTQRILDSHIHLWPANAANPQSHGWMQDGAHLTRQYSIQDYLSATASASGNYNLMGFVYVETDRFIDRDENKKEDISQWAAEPLRELAFLRRIIDGKPEKGEGFDASQSRLLKGIVAWAPLDRGLDVFQEYIKIAEEVVGSGRIKGFRFLLQGIRDKTRFEEVVTDPGFVDALRLMGRKKWNFDIGVDQRQGGNWQLEIIPDVIKRVHEGANHADKAVFVLSTSRLHYGHNAE